MRFCNSVFAGVAFCAAVFSLRHEVHAQDRIFNYTYQSGVLNVGQREIEPWTTFRWGRKNFYRAYDQRIEFELGVAKNLQTAFYLNAKYVAQNKDSLMQKETEFSLSNEWKYKISDPVADPVGFALYQEIKIAPSEVELESKLIFDKRIGPSIVAFNAVGAVEFENEVKKGKDRSEHEFELEADIGWSYQINRGLYLGIEVRNHNEIVEGEWEHSALFAGPTLSYTRDNFWVNITVMPQLAGLKGSTYKGLVLDEHERLETRLIFSYAF